MSNYLFISDAAKEVKVESHVLRYWEEELHLPIKRNELGHRYYTEEDVERFKEIKDLKERGLQLKAIKMILRDGKLDLLPSDNAGKKRESIVLQEKPECGNEAEKTMGQKQPECESKAEKPKGQKQPERENEAEKTMGQEEKPECGNEAEQSAQQFAASAEGGENPKSTKTERVENGQELLQPITPNEEKRGLAIDIISCRNARVVEESKEDKSRRLQWLLQQLIRETLQENNDELCRGIKESVVKELDYQFRMQEEREELRDQRMAERDEEHYKKMDELLRKKSRKAFVIGGKKKKSAP